MSGRVESPEVNTSVTTTRIAVVVRNVYTVVVEATVYANVNPQEGPANEVMSVRKMSDVPTLGIVSRMMAINLLREIGATSDPTAGQIVVAAVDIVSVVTLIWKSWKKSKLPIRFRLWGRRRTTVR